MKKLIFTLPVAAGSCTLMQAQSDVMKKAWEQADRIVASIQRTEFPRREVSITQYGAVANRPDRLAHDAINRAIVEMSLQGGGAVVVPDSTYYTGPITMKSNVRLHLADKAVLKFATDINLYLPPVLTRWEAAGLLQHPSPHLCLRRNQHRPYWQGYARCARVIYCLVASSAAGTQAPQGESR